MDEGTLSFTVEGRLLRELGERLVKQPEVAIVELIKNSYDADATECEIIYEPGRSITVADDGNGMTLSQFKDGWMRIGTSSKATTPSSPSYARRITGEKGIGRFAVRFLGRKLHLESIAVDPERRQKTRLIADFDWRSFDQYEDLGRIKVPYILEQVDETDQTGTTLVISQLRNQASSLELQRVRTESIGVLSPLRSLFPLSERSKRTAPRKAPEDPGFSLRIQEPGGGTEEDVAGAILKAFVLRATVSLKGTRLELNIYR